MLRPKTIRENFRKQTIKIKYPWQDSRKTRFTGNTNRKILALIHVHMYAAKQCYEITKTLIKKSVLNIKQTAYLEMQIHSHNPF